MQNNLKPDKLADLRVAHLNMIQGVISRMSGFSAGVKNFCVTISAAIIAVAYQKHVPMLTGAAVAVVLIFCIMDAYYLALEKRYRELYEQVAERPIAEAVNMSLKAERIDFSTCFRAIRSLSVAGFYVLLLIGVVTLLILANHEQPEQPQTPPIGNSSVVGAAEKPAGRTALIPANEGAHGGGGEEQGTAERAQSIPDANAHTTPGKPVWTH